MMCHECHSHEAVIRIEKVVDGVREEVHLCVDCARKHLDEENRPLESHRVQDLLRDVKDNMSTDSTSSTQKEVTCPNCYLTLTAYRKSGLLGCPDCYVTFTDYLKKDLRQRHGTTGLLRGGNKRGHLPDIRRQLDHALEHENYEKAARLRDQLKREEQSHAQSLDRIEASDRSPLD